MKLSNYFNRVLYLPKSERIGLIILLLIVVVCIILPEFYSSARMAESRVEVVLHERSQENRYGRIEKSTSHFDTNSLPSSDHLAEKGSATMNTAYANRKNSTPKKERATKKKIWVELNNANEEELLLVRGIGPVFASRIIKYRSLLGGFHSVSQLREVYGLKEEFYQDIVPQVHVNAGLLQKLDLNVSSVKQFGRHPYLDWNQANLLVKYREKHGFYQSVQDLNKLELFDEASITKVMPYLSASPARQNVTSQSISSNAIKNEAY